MVIDRYAKAYTEVIEVLESLPEKEYEKIPKEKIEFYEKNKDTNYKFYFDKNKDISKQNISMEANSIIISLFRDYFATKTQKENLKKILYNNEKKHEEELKKIYSVDNIFNNDLNQIKSKEEKNLLIEKSSFISKIINKFKKFFLRI